MQWFDKLWPRLRELQVGDAETFPVTHFLAFRGACREFKDREFELRKMIVAGNKLFVYCKRVR